MIDRYTRKEMADIWSEQNQFQAWLEVELAACWAWSQMDKIPSEDVEKLYKNASFDIDRIKEIEKNLNRIYKWHIQNEKRQSLEKIRDVLTMDCPI